MREDGRLFCDRCGAEMYAVTKVVNTRTGKGRQKKGATAEVCHKCWPDVVGDLTLKDIPYEVAVSSFCLGVKPDEFSGAFPDMPLVSLARWGE